MRINYNFKFQERMKNVITGRIITIMREVKQKKLTFDDYLEMKGKKIYDSEAYKELSHNNKTYARGYIDALYTNMWYNELEWLLYHPDLGLITSEYVPHGEWYRIISEKSCYCWKGTKKVFYISKRGVPIIDIPEHLTWNDVVNGDVIYDTMCEKPFNGPFIVESVDRQYLLNPYNQRFFCCIHLKGYEKKIDQEYS